MIKDFETTVLNIETVATDTKKLQLTKPSGFNFKAGQFLLIKFAKNLMRAYSIASSPKDSFLELIIRIIPEGKGSSIIDKTKIGDKFIISGGMGHFLLSENKNVELYFLATGTGIAPFRSMILTESLQKNPRKMHLFYGGRWKEDLPYLEEISEWTKNLEVKIGLSRDLKAHEVYIPNLPQAKIDNCRITKFIEDENFAENSEFYICGNKGMVEGTRDLLFTKGISKERIFFEKFN